MEQKKHIIINADDCGMNAVVNEHIEKAILAGKITSTTVMANMGDLEGAVELYKKYHDRISFGWHLNLSEGKPLLKSQRLLDYGFYVERDGVIEMNGRMFLRKWLPSDVRNELMCEMIAQYELLRDFGIDISHLDSHHHVHTSTWAVTMIPALLRKTGIKRMRCMFNNKPRGLDIYVRKAWAKAMQLQVPGLRLPEVQSGFEMFMNDGLMAKGNIIELECHPGHPRFEQEEKLLMQTDVNSFGQLMSFCSL